MSCCMSKGKSTFLKLSVEVLMESGVLKIELPEVSDEALSTEDINGSMPELEFPDNLVSFEANVLN